MHAIFIFFKLNLLSTYLVNTADTILSFERLFCDRISLYTRPEKRCN